MVKSTDDAWCIHQKEYANRKGGLGALLKTVPIHASSISLTRGSMLIVSANSHFSKERPIRKPQLYWLPGLPNEKAELLTEFPEQANASNALLHTTQYGTFLGLDNSLFASSNLKIWRKVLETENRKNIFWHMIEGSDGALLLQEYGSPPTWIYRSVDGGETWKKVVSSSRIDKKAKHFHSIAYDQYRNSLIATLGDGNLVKITVSHDNGETWKPSYTWAYQCLPIVILKDKVVFGMDSAISRGLVIWHPAEARWSTVHLKHAGRAHSKDIMQSADLKQLSDDTWIMTTGGGSILSSDDLKNWHVLHFGEKAFFDSHMISNECNGVAAVAMGDSVAIMDTKALRTTRQGVDVKQCSAVFSRSRALGYVVKRRMQYWLG